MTKKILSFNKAYQLKETALTIGFFDGIHLGHQELIKEVVNSKYVPAVLTFSTDLKSIIQHKKEQLILTESEKEGLLSSLGIQQYYVLPFSKEVMSCSPSDFLNFLTSLNAKEIVVGSDFTFGKNAAGKAGLLNELKNRNIKIVIKDLLEVNNEKVSSTTIKNYLRLGQIEKANSLLGYHFFYESEVVKGLQNGRKLGYPTANMNQSDEKINLPDGVYKTQTEIDGKTYASMTNIGTHPTIDQLDKGIIETNVIGFDGNLYGKTIKVSFLSFLREQVKYKSLEELKNQLRIDKDNCR